MLLLEIALEPRRKVDAERLPVALTQLCERDTALQATTDPLSGQTLLGGESETQLDTAVAALTQEFGLAIDIGAPQVAYRESIARAWEHDYAHKQILAGGNGSFARVKLRFQPLPAGSGYVFENAVMDGALPRQFVAAVEKAIDVSRNTGLIAGFPLIDAKVIFVDGAYHDLDSSALAFETAARICFREGLSKAGPKLLEPVMTVEIVTPEEFLGDVIGDLNRRRGQVDSMKAVANDVRSRLIRAKVPLANMFGYANWFFPVTGKLGRFSMVFSSYEPVPVCHPDPDRSGPAAVGIP